MNSSTKETEPADRKTRQTRRPRPAGFLLQSCGAIRRQPLDEPCQVAGSIASQRGAAAHITKGAHMVWQPDTSCVCTIYVTQISHTVQGAKRGQKRRSKNEKVSKFSKSRGISIHPAFAGKRRILSRITG